MSHKHPCSSCGGSEPCGDPLTCKEAGTEALPIICEKCARRRVVQGSKDFRAGQCDAFLAAVEECEAYSKGAQSEEAKAVALNLAIRITQRAKRS